MLSSSRHARRGLWSWLPPWRRAAAGRPRPLPVDSGSHSSHSTNGHGHGHGTRAAGGGGGGAEAAAAAGLLEAAERICRGRYSCKHFDPTRGISVAELERVLESVVRAPTGFNLQGWHVIVVGDNNLPAPSPSVSSSVSSSSAASSPPPPAAPGSDDEWALPRHYLRRPGEGEGEGGGSAEAEAAFRARQLREAKLQKDLLFKAALGQMQVAQAPFTLVFAGDTEPERNAPAAAELGLAARYYSAAYLPAYLRNVYYMLHAGPCHSMAFAKRFASHLYSNFGRRAAGGSEATSLPPSSPSSSSPSSPLAAALRDYTPLLTTPLSPVSYAWKQVLFPANHFLFCATANGWQTCVMEGIDEAAVRRVCGLPERFTIPLIISVGLEDARHPGSARRVPSPRFATSHMVRWGTYG